MIGGRGEGRIEFAVVSGNMEMNGLLSSVAVIWTLFASINSAECLLESDEGHGGGQKYRVEGTVSVPYTNDQSWLTSTRVMVDGGRHLAFLRQVHSMSSYLRSFFFRRSVNDGIRNRVKGWVARSN